MINAPIAAPTDATGAFGVNQVVIGSLQRFADQRRVSLRLCNASDLGEIRSVTLNFDGASGAGLADSLAYRVASLLDVDNQGTFSERLPDAAGAVFPYATGLGMLQGDPQGTRLDSTLTLLEAAQAVDGNFAMGHAAVGRARTAFYLLTGDTTSRNLARSQLARAVELAPDDVYSNLYAADLYFHMELYPKAVEFAEAALRTAPGHPRASRRLGWAYNRQNRFDEAQSVFLNSIRRFPDCWITHFNIAFFYYFRDRLDEAFASWEKALEYAPNDVTTLNNIGAVHHLTGEWEVAGQYFERAFKIRPTEDTCGNMGLSYFFRGEYEESARYYKFALEYADTTQHENWGNLAAAQYWAEGQRDEALESYKTSIRHALREFRSRPEDPYLIAALIDHYSMIGQRDNCLRMVTYGDSVAGDDTDVLSAIGNAYEILGDRLLALRYFREAIRYGHPAVEIERMPSLKELVKDPLFEQMISEEVGEHSQQSDAPPQ
jgi:tetratricopeptide (TPR) repeat protein